MGGLFMAGKKEKNLPITVKLIIIPDIADYAWFKGQNVKETITSLRGRGYSTLPNTMEYIITHYSSNDDERCVTIKKEDNSLSGALFYKSKFANEDIEKLLKEQNITLSKPTDENPQTTYVIIENKCAYNFSKILREKGYTIGSIFPMDKTKN